MLKWLKKKVKRVKEVFFSGMTSSFAGLHNKEELTAEDVENMKKERGTYKTFFQCQSCNYTWEVTVPKGCRYYHRSIWNQPCLRDEESERDFWIGYKCHKCETSDIRVKPDLVG